VKVGKKEFVLGRTDRNGKFKGQLSMRRGQEADIVVEKTNYRRWKQHFVAKRSRKSFEVKLYPKWARLVKLSTRNNIGDVEVFLNGSSIGKTDKHGNLTAPILGKPGQRMTMSFQKEGVHIEPWNFTLGPEGEIIRHQIELWPPKPVSLHLRVFSKNEPVPGVSFVLNGHRIGQTTDANGELLLTGLKGLRIGDHLRIGIAEEWLEKGRKVYKVEPPGGVVVIRPGKFQRYDITFWIKEVVFAVVEIKDIHGNPLSGVRVFLKDKELGRSKNGRFVWELPDPDKSYRLRLQAPWYEGTECQVDRHGPVAVEMKKLFFMAVVKDSVTKQPLANVQIRTSEGEPVATSELTGQARIPIKKLGKVRVTLSKGERYIKQERVVEITKNGEEKIFWLVPVKPQITLTFRWETRDLGPVKNALVEISGSGYIDQGRTDDRGRVRFESYSIEEGNKYTVKIVTPYGTDSLKVGPITVPNYDKEHIITVYVPIEISTPCDAGALIELLDPKGKLLASDRGKLMYKVKLGGHYVVRAEGTPEKGGIKLPPRDIYIDRTSMHIELNVCSPYLMGKKLLDRGDIEGAKREFSREPPNSIYYCEAHKELAEIYRKEGNLASAADEYDKVLNAPNPGEYQTNPSFLLRAATCNYELAHTLEGEDALRRYKRALELVDQAYMYKSFFPRGSKRLLDLYYYKALIPHERYFRLLRENLSKEDRLMELEDLEENWNRFKDEVRNFGGRDYRDYRERMGQIARERSDLR